MMWLSHDGRVFWERGRRTRQYFGRHGMYISIGCRLSLLDMGSCARIRRLGAILGRGTGTSTVRVRVRVRVSGSKGRRARQYFGRHGIYISIGCRLSLLDMGSCARIRQLGAVLGRGAGTSAERLGLGLGFRGRGVETRTLIFLEKRHTY